MGEIAGILTRAGVRLIQIRAKQARRGGQASSPSFVGTSQALLSDTRQLLSLLPSETRLIVNDRADVAHLTGAAGVHLGQNDLPVEAARALLGPDKIVGFSTHTLDQIKAAATAPADYLAFGPVFATATKPDAEPVVGLAGLRAAREQTRKPLVAIGGITPENAAQVIEAGADAVAVISGWLAAADIDRALAAFSRELGGLG